MANEMYRGHEYRTYETQRATFGWLVYGNSNLHPIEQGEEKSRTMAEEAAMNFIDQKRKKSA